MQRRVLITGASGFIGKRLVVALAAGGWTVRAAMRDPTAVTLANVETVILPDLSRPVDWRPLLEGITHVVHLAGLAHSPGVLADAVYDRINADAAGELAQAATGIERLILMSSVRAQAGLSADQAITERDDPEPTDAYGRSKLAAERLVAESGRRFSILRPVVVYGPGVKGNIANLATLARTPMPLPFGALDNRRSLLAIDNLVSAIGLTLVSKQTLGETYLVADRDPITVANLVTAMRDGLGRAPHLMKVPPGAVRRIMASFGKEADWERISGGFVVDTAKLRGIGWEPAVSTYEGIKAMMQDA